MINIGDKVLMICNYQEGKNAYIGIYEINRIDGKHAYLKNYNHELIINGDKLSCEYRVDEGFTGFMHYVGPINYWAECYGKKDALKILDDLSQMRNKYYRHDWHNYRVTKCNMFAENGRKLSNLNEYIEYLKTFFE